MAFRGLFIGIDRYATPDVNWLSRRPRRAGAPRGLRGHPRGRRRTAPRRGSHPRGDPGGLAQLEASSPDDVVVVFFSGHGAPTHHLVAHDTTAADLGATGLALDELTERFTRIPARRLVCVLDRCFLVAWARRC